jgi:2'-5' RNA ligase
MENEFVKINIAFRPPIEIAEKVAQLSLKISQKEGAFFVLDNLNFHPHMTIYFLEYPAYNSEKILEKLENLAKNFSSIKFVASGMKVSRGYIGMATEYSQALRNIHEAIVRETNPFRENHLREEYAIVDIEEILQEKKRNIQQYGHPDVLDLYKPHITITRLRDEQAAERIAKNIEWPVEDFMVDTIGVFKTGENGTCIELIKEFTLNKF